jgi:O-antigen ligase
LTPVVLLLRNKLFKFGFLLLIFGLIILSYKRMALIAFLMSLMVYFYCQSRSGPKANISNYAVIFLGAVLFVGILAISFRYITSAFDLDWSARMSDIVSGGGGGRTGIWRELLSEVASQPGYWLFGHGKGALSLNQRWAHNDIIEILYEFGIIGEMFYICIAIVLSSIFFQMKKYQYKHLGAYAASLVWAFWGGMTDVCINYPYWFLGIALFWGITIGDFELAKQRALLEEVDESSDMSQYDDENAADMPYA